MDERWERVIQQCQRLWPGCFPAPDRLENLLKTRGPVGLNQELPTHANDIVLAFA